MCNRHTCRHQIRWRCLWTLQFSSLRHFSFTKGAVDIMKRWSSVTSSRMTSWLVTHKSEFASLGSHSFCHMFDPVSCKRRRRNRSTSKLASWTQWRIRSIFENTSRVSVGEDFSADINRPLEDFGETIWNPHFSRNFNTQKTTSNSHTRLGDINTQSWEAIRTGRISRGFIVVVDAIFFSSNLIRTSDFFTETFHLQS